MRYIVLLLVLLVGAGFVFINWPAVNAPAEVNLLITTAVNFQRFSTPYPEVA